MVSVFSKNIHFLPENSIDGTQKGEDLRGVFLRTCNG